MPTVLSGVFTIPHQDVVITVQGLYLGPEPKPGINVYLFTGAGA